MILGNSYFNGSHGYDLVKAEEAFKKAVSADHKILYGHYQLARVYFIEKKNKEALMEINKELELNPENLRSLYVRGLIRAETGNLPEAENDFRRFTAWAPKEWAGYNDLAWILSKEGKYAAAAETILRSFGAVEDAENNPWLQNILGVAYLNLKKYSEAESAFKKAQKLADNLNLNEWANAYPGNNKSMAPKGLNAFKEAIQENLRRASLVDNSL